jgi:hypothetical protein
VKIKDIPLPTLVTGIAGVAWLGSFGLRALKPDFALGPAADTMFATCVAWYAKTRLAKEGQDDLLSEVLTKSVVPLISTAHADDPEPPKPAQPYTPKPAQPYTPKPTTPPKPGGMPWGP